jgi:recombinational DNA repair ATPase RecF
LAVCELIRQHRGTAPLLLFDEIFAELDSRRSLSLIASFENVSQLFLTTAVSPPVELRGRGRSFEIRDGKVEDGN